MGIRFEIPSSFLVVNHAGFILDFDTKFSHAFDAHFFIVLLMAINSKQEIRDQPREYLYHESILASGSQIVYPKIAFPPYKKILADRGLVRYLYSAICTMGSSVAYFYSVAVLLYPFLGQHVYFETSAVIITLIKLGKMLGSRTKRRTGGAIRKLMGLRPKTATIFVDGKETYVPLAVVKAEM